MAGGGVKGGIVTAQQMNTAMRPWKSRAIFMTGMPQFFIFLVWITSNLRIAMQAEISD